jgi:hypothetical protein
MTSTNEPKKRKLVHPLWTHLPVAAALVVFLVFLFTSLPLPAQAPVHFSFDGVPNGYGSPWAFVWFLMGFTVFFTGLSALLDELWARQESARHFNWLSLMDDAAIGWMLGLGTGYLQYLRGAAEASFSSMWVYAALVGAGTIVFAVILEFLRPYRGAPAVVATAALGKDRAQKTEEAVAFSTELARHLKENTAFIYWDYQNPFWVTLISLVMPLVFFAAAAVFWFSIVWNFYLFMAIGILLFLPYGGQRVLVKREDITVRWGIVGIKVLHLKMDDITDVELHCYAALRDFGGYGIRFNTQMTAYILGGNTGVKITTVNGKKYLVGSDQPERLLAVLRAVSAKQ